MIPRDGFFYPHQAAMIDFFLAYLFISSVNVFNVGVAIIESSSYTFTFAIFKVDVVIDVTMTLIPNVLTTELRDLLYNQCIDNMCCVPFFFIYPTGRIRVCKIRFVSTGENRGKPCLVCKTNTPCRNCAAAFERCV